MIQRDVVGLEDRHLCVTSKQKFMELDGIIVRRRNTESVSQAPSKNMCIQSELKCY